MDANRRSRSPCRGHFIMESSHSAQVLGSKRQRPVEADEIVLDNYHSHKRYLTEVMASSLNGLRVADPGGRPGPCLGMGAAAFHMEFGGSPAATDTPSGSARSASPFPSHGDEMMSTLDSAMSDDSEDSVGWRAANSFDLPVAGPGQQSTVPKRGNSGSPPSPGSPKGGKAGAPHVNQSPKQGHAAGWGAAQSPRGRSGAPNPWAGQVPPGASWQQQTRPASIPNHRGLTSPRHLADAMEGRLPPSPSDPNQSANLRRAALLRALQMRTQPCAVVSGAGEAEPDLGSSGEEAGPDPVAGSPPGSPPTTSGLHPSLLGLASYTPEFHKDRSAASNSATSTPRPSSFSPMAAQPRELTAPHRQGFSSPLPASALGRAHPGLPSCETPTKSTNGQDFARGRPNLKEVTWRSAGDDPICSAPMQQASGETDPGASPHCRAAPSEALASMVPMDATPSCSTPRAAASGSWSPAQWQRARELGCRAAPDWCASSVGVGYGSDSQLGLQGEGDPGEAAWRAWSLGPAGESSGPGPGPSVTQQNLGKRSGSWRTGLPEKEGGSPSKRMLKKVAMGPRHDPRLPFARRPGTSSHQSGSLAFSTLSHTAEGKRTLGEERSGSPGRSLSDSGETL